MIRSIASDVFIYVDTAWPFIEIQPVVASLLENLNVNRFGSRFTLFNAADAAIIVNTTNSLSLLHTTWTLDLHTQTCKNTFKTFFSKNELIINLFLQYNQVLVYPIF